MFPVGGAAGEHGFPISFTPAGVKLCEAFYAYIEREKRFPDFPAIWRGLFLPSFAERVA